MGAIIALGIAGIKIAFDIIYKVLKVLKLQLLLSVLFVGLVLYFTNVLFNPENKAVTYIWIVFLALGFFYAVIGNVNRIKKLFSGFEKNRKEKLKNRVEQEQIEEEKQKIIEEKKELEQLKVEIDQQKVSPKDEIKVSKIKERYPKYYRVSQNKDYVMAEYKDRYELYLKKDGKLFKVRTDAKKESVWNILPKKI